MSGAKRGKLRSVSIRPLDDGSHVVSADHEAAPSSGKDTSYSYMPAQESAHETVDSAMDAAKAHLQAHQAKFGKKKARAMREVIGSA